MTTDLRVGVITKSHGIKGEVKVYPTTDSPFRFDEITHVKLVLHGKEIGDFKIGSVKYFKDQVILKLKGIDDISVAEKYKGADLYIPREEGAELKDGEYYIADIIGMKVVLDTGETLGTVKDVLETGANDVYIVERPGAKDVMIPAIKQCILDTDIENDIMTVHLLDGLLDL
ncbi:MAG: ribosome maturation factor RimM [Eubacteriales bacterium]|nr:ribosome maturation factor RimM [Eubacteriales bacterium]